MQFEPWLESVERVTWHRWGLHALDMADKPAWRALWDGGLTPSNAASAAARRMRGR